MFSESALVVAHFEILWSSVLNTLMRFQEHSLEAKNIASSENKTVETEFDTYSKLLI